MRKVLIGTPCYDGKTDAWYNNSLMKTVKRSYDTYNKEIFIHAIYVSYDSLVQRARNSLFQMMLTGDWTDLFFIDSDTEWNPDDFYSILLRPEHIVGAPLIKKSDQTESYTAKIVNKKLSYSSDGKLIEVDGIGSGFMRLSRFAVEKLWNVSEVYYMQGVEQRMVCDLKVVGTELISEDYVIANKWKSLGYKVWADPNITINHIGYKKYEGNFKKFITDNDYA